MMLCDLPPEIQAICIVQKTTGSGFAPGKNIVSRGTQASYPPSTISFGSFYQGSLSRTAAWVQSEPVMVAWRKYVCDVAASADVDALTETAEAVLDSIQAHGPALFNLKGLHAVAVNGEHLATVLRTSFTWRDQVPGWHEALRVAEVALTQAGVDPEDALFGLI